MAIIIKFYRAVQKVDFATQKRYILVGRAYARIVKNNKKWGTNMHPQPIFQIGSLGVYPYGLCMAVGIILCFVFLLLTMKYKKFNGEAIDKLLLIGVFGTGFGIFAAMLFQSVYNYIAAPEKGFTLGGMTFIGGLIGGVVSFLAVYFLYIYVIAPAAKKGYAKRVQRQAEGGDSGKKRSEFSKKFLTTTNKILIKTDKLLQNNMNATLTDALPFIPIGICIAHAFGRLGCFFGGCCYGKPDDIYGVACASGFSKLLQMNMTGVKVVPLQLFEMSFLIALAGAMAFLYFRYKFTYNFGLYAAAYGVWRFVIEFYRGDDRGSFLGSALSPSQFWSIFMVLAGIGFIFLQKYVLEKHMKHPELQKTEDKTANKETCAEPTQSEN